MAPTNDRVAAFETQGIGFEAAGAPGVPVSATHILNSGELAPGIESDNTEIKPRGNKYVTMTLMDNERTSGDLSGKMPYTEPVFPFTAGLCLPVTSVPAGAVTANHYEWTPDPQARDEYRTATLEVGTGRNLVVPYTLFTGLKVQATRKDGISFTGSFMGGRAIENHVQYVSVDAGATGTFAITVGGTRDDGTFATATATAGLAVNATAADVQAALVTAINTAFGITAVGGTDVICTGGPLQTDAVKIFLTGQLEEAATNISVTTQPTGGRARLRGVNPAAAGLELIPVLGKHICWHIATDPADLGTETGTDVKLIRAFDGTFDLQSIWDTVFAMDCDEPSYVALVEGDQKSMFTMKVGADDQGMQYLVHLRQGITIYTRMIATGALFDPNCTTQEDGRYKFTYEASVKLNKVSKFGKHGQVTSIDFSGPIAYSSAAGWNKALTVRLQNNIAPASVGL